MNKIFLLLALAFFTGWYGKKEDALTILHARQGLPNFFHKLEKEDTVVVAYLGGSITGAQGYRVQTAQWLRQQYPHSYIKAVNAGVGGTGSDLGVFRLQEDVLQYNPDLVFIEFAVNDGGDSLNIGNAMEGIVRQIKKHNAHTDICFLYTVSEPMLKQLQQGQLVRSMRFTENIADYYGLPSINLSVDVMGLLEKDALVFHAQKGNDYGTRTIFTYDGVHPTTEGHKIYTTTISKAFGEMAKIKASAKNVLPAPLYPGCYEQTAVFSPTLLQRTKGWKRLAEKPELKGFATAFPDLLYTNDPRDSITIRFKGTIIGVQDLIGPTSGAVLVTIDGQKPVRKYRFDIHGGRYRRSYYLLDTLAAGMHTVVLKLDPAPMNKTKMVKPAELGDTAQYKENCLYIGKVMMVGELK